MVEGWQKTYSKEIEIYDSFSKYEDENNKVLKKLFVKFSFDNKIVLDIGCGSGKYIEFLAPKSKKYYALEISKPLIELAKRRYKKFDDVEFINCSAEKIPLEDNLVDVIFASWTLTAMVSEEMRENSIKEMLRVLKEGGNIWLFENYWEGEFMNMRDRKEFEKANISNLVKKYGFEISEIVDTNFFFPSLDEAKRILGFVFKENALNYLEENPNPKMKHKVIILHRTKNIGERD